MAEEGAGTAHLFLCAVRGPGVRAALRNALHRVSPDHQCSMTLFLLFIRFEACNLE